MDDMSKRIPAVLVLCAAGMALSPFRALQYVFGTIFVELLLDFGLVKHVFTPKARYFVLHVCFNSWLSYVVWGDSVAALRFPEAGMTCDSDSGSGSPGFCDSAVVTTAGITGFHVYHTLFFTGISAEDWVHHIVSCVVVPLIGINAPFGRVVSLSNLGMCGIPGALDYAMLAALKTPSLAAGKMARWALLEKRVNSMLNLLVRWPLMLLSSYIFAVGWSNGTLERTSALGAQLWVRIAMAVGCLLHTANAAYYAQKVIGNYYVKHEQAKSPAAKRA